MAEAVAVQLAATRKRIFELTTLAAQPEGAQERRTVTCGGACGCER